MDDVCATKMLAALDRIEKRQMAYEIVAHRILTCIEIQNEKLGLIITEMNRDPGPSPTTTVLTEILGTMKRQAELMEGMAEDDMTPEWNENASDDSDELLDSRAVR